VTFQGDEESGTREEAPLTPAPRQKVSEILGNNLDVFKVCFFSEKWPNLNLRGMIIQVSYMYLFLSWKMATYRTTKFGPETI